MSKLLTLLLIACSLGAQVPSSSVIIDVAPGGPPMTYAGPLCVAAGGARDQFFRTNRFDVCVVGRKFGDVYGVKVQRVIQRGTGLIEIRSVDDAVTPAAANSGGAAAKGTNVIGSVKIEPRSVGEVLNLLLNEKTRSSVEDEVRTTRQLLVDQGAAIDRDLRKLIDDFDRLINPVTIPSAGVSPSLGTLIYRLNAELGALVPVVATEQDFKRHADQVDFLIADFKQLKGAIASATVIEELRVLTTNVAAFRALEAKYRRMLEVVGQGATLADRVLNSANAREIDSATRRMELRKELFDKFKASGTDETEINRTLDLMDGALGATASAGTSTLAATLAAGYPSTAFAGVLASHTANLGLAEGRRNDYLVRITELNNTLAAVMDRMNAIQAASNVREMAVIPVPITETGNLDVEFSLLKTATYKKYRMESVAPQTLGTPGGGGFTAAAGGAAAATPAAGGAAATPAAAGSAATGTTPAPEDQGVLYQVSVHKFWRAAFVAGFAFSSLRERDYRLQDCLPGQALEPGLTTRQQCIAQSDAQRPQIHYIAGVHYYFKPKDSYPGAYKGAAAWTPGIFGGLALNRLNHYFVGPAFEPVLGLHFSAGYHFGQVKRLQQGVDPSKPALGSAVSGLTRNVGDHGFYFMIGFDYKIFDKMFGGNSKVKLVNP